MPDTDGFLARWSRRKVQAQQGPAERDAVAATEPVVPRTAVAPAVAVAQQPAAASAAAATWPAAPADTAAELSPGASPPGAAAIDPPPPAPTLEEAQRLTTADDFSRFVGRGVDPQVKNTALRTLFSDPHFNVMDGLDTYIDDYGKPDPLPPGMLRQMVQSSLLGLFDDEGPEAANVAAKVAPNAPAIAAANPAANAATALDDDASEPFLPAPLPRPATPDEDPALRLQPNDAAGPAGDPARAEPDPGRQP
jgi:hypothetical protein